MDTENELARAKWLITSIFVFLGTGCISWNEFVFLIYGKSAEGQVVEVYEITRASRFGPRRETNLDYTFIEADGSRRKGTVPVSDDWQPPASGKVEVRYTPGKDGDSRLAGQVSWGGLIIFGLALGAIGVFAYRLGSEAIEATRDTKPRRSRK